MEENESLEPMLQQLLVQLQQANNDNEEIDIVMQLINIAKDDQTKLKLLETIGIEEYRIMIIRSLENEDKKIEQIDNLVSQVDKANIIMGIQDDDKKVNLVNKIIDKNMAISVLCSIKDENKRILALEKIKDISEFEEIKLDIYKSIQDDNKKIKLSKNLKKSEQRAKLIATLKSDDTKIKILNQFGNSYDKLEIIKSIQDEDKRISQIDFVIDYDVRYNIIQSLYNISEDKKIELLDKLKDKYISRDDLIFKVANDLVDEDKKIQALEKIKKPYYKLQVIKQIKDDAKKLELFEQAKEMEYKVGILMLVENDEIKMPIIDNIQSNIYRNLAILNLSSDNIKKYINIQPQAQIDLPDDMSIGIEIESQGRNGRFIKTNDYILHQWNVKGDISLDEANGVEVTSPIMYSNKENSQDIYTVCEMLMKMGQISDESCGGHIHIGSNYFNNRQSYENLMNIWCNLEEEIYVMSNKEGEIPRGIKYSTPISESVKKALNTGQIDVSGQEELDEYIEQLKDVQDIRTRGINLLRANNGIQTIEFRISNGTLDAKTWIENINFFGGIMAASKCLADIQLKKEELSNAEKEKLSFLQTIVKSDNSQDKVNAFVNLITDDEEKRKIYINRYITNHKILESMPEKKKQINYQMTKEHIDLSSIKEAVQDIRQGEIDAQMEQMVRVMKEPQIAICGGERSI